MQSPEFNALADDDDDDDEPADLQEPLFKYKRASGELGQIFQEDAASCFLVHDRFIVLGTQWGRVCLLDHEGNLILNKSLVAHSVAVNNVCVDQAGEHVASCANDGKVVIYSLFSSEQSRLVTMDRPIRCVAIHPNFARSTSCHQFVTGDRVLVLHEKALFTGYKQQVLFVGKERDGYIHCISWRATFIAFANETGILVYDKVVKSLLTHIARRHELTWRCELLPAHICWFDDLSFMIGWANTLTVCAISEQQSTAALIDSPFRFVEVRHVWEFQHYLISGCSYTPRAKGTMSAKSAWQEIVLFAVSTLNASNAPNLGEHELFERDEAKFNEQHNCPRVVLVEPVNFQQYSVVSEDIIEMKDCSTLSCHQYHFGGLPADSTYFLLSTKDFIQMKCCSDDDRIGWMLSKRLFNKALDYANSHSSTLRKYSSSIVGKQYLDHLLQLGHYSKAASICQMVCGTLKDLWEYYVTRFDQMGQLIHLVGVLPTNDPQLEPECYQCVLMELLNKDVTSFKRLVGQWSPELYRVSALVKEVTKRLQKKQQRDTGIQRELLTVLAQLYTHEQRFQPAVEIYLKLGDKSLFALVERSKLFHLVKDRIHQLISIDTDLAIRLLLKNEDSLSPDTVMKQLMRLPKLQLTYLEKLFARGEGEKFADLAVTLYADYNRPRLLQFLNDCEHYTLDKALDICRRNHLTSEAVFLLAKSGNRHEALKVIITEMNDVRRAIDFCLDQDDQDLWLDLIEYSVKRQHFLVVLMQCAGLYVDPRLVIDKLPADVKIPHLKEAIKKLLLDHCTQLTIQESGTKITTNDCYDLMVEYVNRCRSRTVLNANQQCPICDQNLLTHSQKVDELIVFNCHHVYHLKCLSDQRKCILCSM